MLPREAGIPVEVLREAVRQRATSTSLRVAAKEVGMSHRGLEDFIGGRTPHPKTRQKLTEWYLKRVAGGQGEVSAEVAEAALQILVSRLPLGKRAEVRNQISLLLEQ